MAPELLPYQQALVEQIYKLINAQEERVAQNAGGQSKADARFYLNIMRMEVERVKYLLKSYLRSRLVKIERFLFYLVEKDQAHLLS